VVSNGYLVVGGGTGADVQYFNQSLPDPTPPNNVLAPFWSDLNPGVGGAVRIGILSGGGQSWIVIDYDAAKEYSTSNADSFEVWIGINGVEDITFTYGLLEGNGDSGFMTVGVENLFGNRGANYYVDGSGTLPVEGTELLVTGTPGVPSAAQTITYSAKGGDKGAWVNYAEMIGNLFQGKSIAGFSGTVTK